MYIDGYNLYYGAVKDTPWKWLNIQEYFETVRQDDEIQEIVYFTSMVANNSAARGRQEIYLKALRTLPKVRIVEGRYKPKSVYCRVSDCHFAGRRRFRVAEEKQTDVAIGVHMLDDAYRDRCDRLIVVSGDSDLIPAVRMVKRRFGTKTVHVYVPARDRRRGAAKELRAESDNDRTLPNELIPLCQFPDEIETTEEVISKPPEWSAAEFE